MRKLAFLFSSWFSFNLGEVSKGHFVREEG